MLVAVIVVGVGQLGHIPVPRRYRVHEDAMYRAVAQRSRADARSADVIVMGDSRVLFGVEPRELARALRMPGPGGAQPKVVSLAGPATIPSSDLWLWRRIASGPAPPSLRLAVIGLAPVDFTRKTPGVDNALRYLFGLKDVEWLARAGRGNDAATLLTYRAFPLYACRRSVINLVLREPQRDPPLPPPSTENDAWWVAQHEGWYEDYRIDDWEVRCLEQMVAEMRARGVRVVLFAPPVANSLLRVEAGVPLNAVVSDRALQNGDPKSPLHAFRVMMAEFESKTGVGYLNYMRADYGRRYQFWDPTHLLPASAAEFTRDLAAEINARS